MYARIVSTIVEDPVAASTQAEVAQCFHPGYIANKGGLQAWVSVPDGTKNGAKDNGNGTFTNPPTISPPEREYTKKEIRTKVDGVLGVPTRQGILEAIKTNADTTNAAKSARAALDAWLTDTSFTKTEFGQILQAFQNVSAITAQQRTDVLAVL